MYVFNRMLHDTDKKFLAEEFSFTEQMAQHFVSNYRTIGLVFRLHAVQLDASRDWRPFLKKVFKHSTMPSKFDTIFIGAKDDKLMLVTNKRLLKIDIKHINEQILDVNFRIESCNERIAQEVSVQDTQNQYEGFLGKIVNAFK
ncbi:MAG: hypothetical protein O2779_02305 [Nanoarchaeota archaeon]|nr:hypothetical protein [Nanoarchaeota archaeon]